MIFDKFQRSLLAYQGIPGAMESKEALALDTFPVPEDLPEDQPVLAEEDADMANSTKEVAAPEEVVDPAIAI